jgi:hypothetical protein
VVVLLDEFNGIRPREFGVNSMRKEQLHKYDKTALTITCNGAFFGSYNAYL